VTQTTMSTNLLQPFQILAKLRVYIVGENLIVFAVDNILLSVEEPGGDLVLGGVLDDGNDALEFFGREFTGALVEIDIGLLADQVGVATADTLDLGQGVHNLLLAIDVGIEETQNELEVRLLPADERHDGDG